MFANCVPLLSWFRLIACAATAINLCGGLSQSQTQGTTDLCHEIIDLAARSQCYELSNALANQTPLRIFRTALQSGWNLVRTPNPTGGTDVVAVTRTADFHKSDPMLAGITLRCTDGTIDMLMVVLQSYPPRSKIDVTIKIGEASYSTFGADIVPPGAMVRLESEATMAIMERGQQAGELHVQLSDGKQPAISGVIALDGFGKAIEALRSLCILR